LDIKKSRTAVPAGETPDGNDIAEINKYTQKTLSPSEVYTFSVTLCDNDVDRDFERFTVSAIHKFAEMFKGVTGLFDHSMSAKDQTARIYKTAVETDPSRQNAAGETYTRLKAWCYMLRLPKYDELIGEIEGGIKKEASIGCSVGKVICSLCGANLKQKGCGHIKGKKYDGVICHSVLSEPTDAYEWSFVAVPAQKNAGVTKASFVSKNYNTQKGGMKNMDDILKLFKSADSEVTLKKTEISALAEYIEKLTVLSKDGEAYKSALVSEVTGLAASVLPKLDAEAFKALCETLQAETLKNFKAAFSEKTDCLPQLNIGGLDESADNNNFNQFKI